MSRRLSSLLFLVLAATSPAADAAELSLVIHPRFATAAGETLEATVSAVPFGIADRAAREKEKRTWQSVVPGRVTLDLPPETQWRVSVDMAGYFADAQVVAGDAGAQFVLWPTAFLEGEFVVGGGAAAPRQAIVRFEPHDPAAADAPPASFSVCALDKQKWRCEVAAGRIDVRLRATGFITHFRSGLEVRPGKTLNLGSLRLERGASVTGYVRASDKIDIATTRVTLVPVTHEHPQQASKGALSTRVQNAKGLFEFRGVVPGHYKLLAVRPPLSSDEVEVVVQENSEAELREPLTLVRPRQLRIRVDPPLDPSGKRWHITVLKEVSSSRWETASESAADANGELTWAGLRSGRFSVNVGVSSDSTQAVEEIDAGTEDVDLSISIPETRVEGTLALGSSPLEAAVVIGGSRGAVSARLQAGPDGDFTGVVPFLPGDRWLVTIEREQPRLQRTLEYDVPKPVDGAPVRLDIVLPSGMLTGRVVDSEGRPVDRATVNVRFPSVDEGLIQIQAGRDGTFALDGLSPGGYDLQAWTFDRRDSDVMSVTVTADGDDPPVRLVVMSQNEVLGRVLSRAGPVQGARVFLYPTDAPSMAVIPRTTDPDGVFVVTVPRGCREANIAITALGLPFKTQHVVLDGRPMTFGLEQTAGTIEVDAPALSDDPSAPQGFLLHNGALLPLYFFVSTRDTRLSASSREGRIRATIPLMEPGDYAVCRLNWQERNALGNGLPVPGRCSFGTLTPFGSLTLTAP